MLTGLLLSILIWRARKPLKLPALVTAVIKLKQAGLKPVGRALRLPWDYLKAEHALRYKSSWILLIGQQGAGKSSLLASIDPALWETPSEHQEQLAGCNWRFLAQGALIDPPGGLPAAAADSEQAQAWLRLLAQLDELRPERPIDGVMLVLSARGLQVDSAADRLALAASLRAQLSLLERQYEFALPVYVVVSEMDSIAGCNAFWHTQNLVQPHEIMGWSMPQRLAADMPGNWVDTAFDSLGEQLRHLQVRAAAAHQHIDPEQADQFFLFPRHFSQLRAPLRQCMDIVFQSSSWQSGGFCRGLYFTGAIADPAAAGSAMAAAQADAPRSDIAFVDDLISKKIFAEPGLARPTRSGIWSRSRALRRAQIAGVAMLAVLLLSLAWAGVQLQRQTVAIRSGLLALQKIEQQVAATPPPAGSCIDRKTVVLTLEQIARFQNNTVYWAMPASWFDRQVSKDSMLQIANGAMRNVVLAGIACQLEQQAQALMTAPPMGVKSSGALAHQQMQQAQQAYGRSIARLQANLSRFQQIGASTDAKAALASFIALCNDTYRTVLPAAVTQGKGALGAALRQTQYGRPLKLPDDMKTRQAAQLKNAARQLAQQVNTDVERGAALLAQLDQDGATMTNSARQFGGWLQWVDGSWSGSTLASNPCRTLETQMQEQARQLRGYGYPDADLNAMAVYFDAARCYQPNISKLAAMQIAPYGSLFSRSGARAGKTLTLNPQLRSELAGLNALLPLSFMQPQEQQPFACRSKVAGWRASDIGLANRYVADYDQFLSGLAVSASAGGTSQQPLYQRVALRQLELALNSSLNHAQLGAGPELVAVDAAASEDQALARESSNFSGLLEPLLTLQRSYRSKGYAASETQLNQCISNYSSDSLARVQNLSDISRLYEAVGSSGSGPMFDLGSTPVIKDFLAAQQARAQVLAGYATPFLNYLNNSSGQNSARNSNTQSAPYWSNTITELNNYVQFKEPSGQVAQLNTLFLKQLPALDASNCAEQMASQQPAAYGNDMFSARRMKLLGQVQANCQGERNAQAASSYSALAARFNRELAGRYPFGPLSGADAGLLSVRNFFADYTAQSAALRQSLQGLNGAYWNSARQFLAQLDNSAKFFQGTLNLNPAPPAAASASAGGAKPAAPDDGGDNASLASLPVKLAVQFHAQANSSPGAEQLVGWSLSSGSKSAAFPNRSTTLDWNYGQALILDLTWASGSLWLPSADLQQGDLQTSGVGASFAASGDWALLRLIERHQPVNGQLPPASAPNRLLLEFLVPVVSNTATPGKVASGTAKLYIGLNLSGTDPKTHAPVSLKLPLGFPRSAP